jgi:hypothetical protein
MAMKICQHLPSQHPPKFTLIGIFGLKTNHLATQVGSRKCNRSTAALKAYIVGDYFLTYM